MQGALLSCRHKVVAQVWVWGGFSPTPHGVHHLFLDGLMLSGLCSCTHSRWGAQHLLLCPAGVVALVCWSHTPTEMWSGFVHLLVEGWGPPAVFGASFQCRHWAEARASGFVVFTSQRQLAPLLPPRHWEALSDLGSVERGRMAEVAWVPLHSAQVTVGSPGPLKNVTALASLLHLPEPGATV